MGQLGMDESFMRKTAIEYGVVRGTPRFVAVEQLKRVLLTDAPLCELQVAVDNAKGQGVADTDPRLVEALEMIEFIKTGFPEGDACYKTVYDAWMQLQTS